MATNYTELNARVASRRDTDANWIAADPILLDGEIVVVDTDTGEVRKKIGDGTSHYSELDFDDEVMKDLVNTKSVEAESNAKSYAAELNETVQIRAEQAYVLAESKHIETMSETEPVIELSTGDDWDQILTEVSSPNSGGITVTDDGEGNVTVISASATDDGAGNVTIS